MTTLEYMKRELVKHRLNLRKAIERKALDYEIDNIERKIKYYEDVVEKLQGTSSQWLINPDGYYPYCSRCNTEPKGRVMTKFCPECGAEMQKWDREVKNDG